MERHFDYDIMTEIKERWSARALAPGRIDREEVFALLEAARYAPSCFNEQPWRFVLADEEGSLDRMRGILTESNQRWANKAPVLILIVSKKTFNHNGKDNYWHMFDAGTAWGYLSLEAWRRGLVAHPMAGFKREEARDIFNIPQEYDIITVIAVGKHGLKEDLEPDLQEREHPDTRKEIRELLL
ncbi:nitroreductase family protein [Parasporobacterium paucivorans]|uniref:Nitroreductase n=1 Tax=Parasporobacterium paucivorans DSM 15970 TaxID=1122934 RepID=A0A1M6GFZ3_9FIRM|nr:nitroreductase family protein [Parasporobacterium paucivorans]SHJ08876.1 Nitroreductase [Parasporobacterium paucivorans DSM 15970]